MKPKDQTETGGTQPDEAEPDEARAAAASPDAPRSPAPHAAITLTLSLSMLLASLGTSMANIALPRLASAFAAPFAAVQGVVIAYLAALTACVLVAGRLGDRYGLRRMQLLGLFLFALASLCCALAQSLPALIGARALQGLGAAFLFTLSMALARQTAAEARVGRAMGLIGTVSALGTALGPALGGLILPLAGWRGLFWVQVPLALLALVLSLAALPRDRAGAGREGPGLRAVMRASLLPPILLNMTVAAVMMTTLVVGPFYLALGLGLKETAVGLVMAAGPAMSIASGLPSGWLVDALGPGRVMRGGLFLLVLGALLLALAAPLFGVIGYLAAIAVLTPGYQLFQAANNTDALAEVESRLRGTVSGLLGLSRNLGLILGASLMGAVFAAGTGTQDFPHAGAAAVTAGMRLTFLIAAGGMALATLLSVAGPLRARLRAAAGSA